MADDNEKPARRRDIIFMSQVDGNPRLFFPLLQMGFKFPAAVPCTLWEFLLGQVGLRKEYISERITTVFVDGRATDNLESTVIRNGSTIALSAAMPGVAGATFRRGSYYAAMRKDITAREDGYTGGPAAGEVCIKLFNLMLNDLGAAFLRMGITVASPDLIELFKCMPDNSLLSFKEVLINNKKIGAESLRNLGRIMTADTVMLSVD